MPPDLGRGDRATRRKSGPQPSTCDDRGQSTVEFALVLPIVAILLLGLIQVGLVLKDQILVTGAAREAAREAAVSPDLARVTEAARRAAPGLKLAVEMRRGDRRGDPVTVDVSATPTALPLIGKAVEGRTLTASATMRVERGG